jgi:transaldolase
MTKVALVSSPLLRALQRAGTAHVYGDTADADELQAVVSAPDGALLAEVDGNTVNQPLVHKVLDRYLAGDRLREAGDDLPNLYTILCSWIGRDAMARFAGDRQWDVSLQLHMRAVESSRLLATQLGRSLAETVPSCLVKVPFKPQAPHCFLIARDLEESGITVNFTSTFSARQAVAAALLANVARTNVFLGRLNQGLHAKLLGEHVVLEAQRALRKLRRDNHAKTLLIAASMRDWQTFLHVAGCDAYTAPPKVLADFLHQTELDARSVTTRLETSYAGDLGVDGTVQRAIGDERLRRLWTVEPEFIAFLLEYRASADYRDVHDGEALARRFEAAGFGDFFYVPTSAEHADLRRSKLPDLDAPLTKRLALDTLYTLLADADFEKEQAAIDRAIASRRAAAA